MTLISEAQEFLRRLAHHDIPHMLVGAMALDAVGTPRATLDIDIQIQMDAGPEPHASEFLGALVEERTTDPVFEQQVIILHLPTYAVPIEVFLSSHWFTRQALERRRWIQSEGIGRVPVPTPEDFILLKSAYHESPHRSKMKRASDGVDIEGVVRVHRDVLDRAYVEENAKALGIESFVTGVLTDVH